MTQLLLLRAEIQASMHRRSRRREIMISAAMSDHFTRNLSDLLRQNRPPAIISRVPLWHAQSLPFTIKDTIHPSKPGFVTTNFAIVIVYISKRVYILLWVCFVAPVPRSGQLKDKWFYTTTGEHCAWPGGFQKFPYGFGTCFVGKVFRAV